MERKGPTVDKAKKGLPKGWTESPFISRIIADRFVTFKTPLCSFYDEFRPQFSKTFTPNDVLTHENLEKRRMELWIDITDTDRFYRVEEVRSHGCRYLKLPLEYQNCIPTETDIWNFNFQIDKFLTLHPDGLIGVHSTNGVNQPGFLICAYICARMKWPLEQAISEVTKKQEGGIIQRQYLDKLHHLYVTNQKPEWSYGFR